MADQIFTGRTDRPNAFNGNGMLPALFFQIIALDSEAAYSIATAGNLAKFLALCGENVVFGDNAFRYQFFKSLRVIKHAGLAVQEGIGDIFAFRMQLAHMGLFSQRKIRHSLDYIKAAGLFNQLIFDAAAGAGTEFQNGNALAIRDQLDQHR